MATFLDYVPYILGVAIAVLILVGLCGGSSGRKRVEPWRPKQRYHRKTDDGLPHGH